MAILPGYAGYAPAKLPPPKPTAVQAALWKVQDPAALELIAKLLRNAAVNPKEEKFRQIRLSNPKIQSLFGKENGALEALLTLGWEKSKDEEDKAVIPEGRTFSMAEVRYILSDAVFRHTCSTPLRLRNQQFARLSLITHCAILCSSAIYLEKWGGA